jgi:hypothetical protein
MKTLAAIAGIVTFLLAQPGEAETLLERYQAGVADASVAEKSERANDLVAVTRDNATLVWSEDRARIKVVTWKTQQAYAGFFEGKTATSDNPAYPVWVTVAPHMQERCRQFRHDNAGADKADVELYLKQFLGLHPDWSYDLFVELWVSPDALFRPCVDPEPTDRSCEINFSPTITRQVKGIPDYRAYYEALYFKSFRSPPGVPWTGLGYTYNWGDPANEQGASEFILAPGTAYEIARATPTMEYCQPE